MAKKLSTLSTHKIRLTLMDQQQLDHVRTAHEHIWSVCLCSFVLSTLAHGANLVWYSADLSMLKCVPGFRRVTSHHLIKLHLNSCPIWMFSISCQWTGFVQRKCTSCLCAVSTTFWFVWSIQSVWKFTVNWNSYFYLVITAFWRKKCSEFPPPHCRTRESYFWKLCELFWRGLFPCCLRFWPMTDQLAGLASDPMLIAAPGAYSPPVFGPFLEW